MTPCNKPRRSYTLAEIAEINDLKFRGDENLDIFGLGTLQEATSAELSFLASANYAKYLSTSKAGAVILSSAMAEEFVGNCIIASNPYLAFAKISALFDFSPSAEARVHSAAHIDSSASVDASASVAAGAVIEAGVSIAAGVSIGANCVVGADTVIGENTLLHPNSTIAYGVTLGANCIVHSGAVIGSDGFGFAPNKTDRGLEWVKIYQLGGVILGDNVEIGANTSIDRGALGDTVIADGVKIDNQCQIAHNVTIGSNTAIAAGAAIAGSTSVGANCTIAGCVGIVGHLSIVDGVHVTGMSMVSKSITKAGSYSSGTPMTDTVSWRKNAVRMRQLDQMSKRISILEKSL